MSRLLKEGRSGEDVKELQEFLIKQGYLQPGDDDGDFGAKTKAAVTEFQKAQGLTPDGECGPKTWAQIEKLTEKNSDSNNSDSASRRLVKEGRSGEDVKELQEFLIQQGYLQPGSADGDFGAKTKAAVTEFQKAQGLTPDGECGPTTWAKVDLIAKGDGDGSENISRRLLKEGRSGEDVKELQGLLIKQGYLQPGDDDGDFGAKTKTAVIEFQKAQGLTQDGEVGPLTWTKINQSIA
ncbi:MAG: peptidoglycan-binding protein [Symploca sp. SIO3C6]|nr:peptidoglycan-binding protein [Symploca sp. SIO3C6]